MYTWIEVRVADQRDNLPQAALHCIHVEPISGTVCQGSFISCTVGTCQEDGDPAKVVVFLEYLHGLPSLLTRPVDVAHVNRVPMYPCRHYACVCMNKMYTSYSRVNFTGWAGPFPHCVCRCCTA